MVALNGFSENSRRSNNLNAMDTVYVDPSADYLLTNRGGKFPSHAENRNVKDIVNVYSGGTKEDAKKSRAKPSKYAREKGFKHMDRGYVTDMHMLTESKNVYFNHNKKAGKECEYGKCSTYAINNAVGRPTLTYAAYKRDYALHGNKDQEEFWSGKVNKNLDKRGVREVDTQALVQTADHYIKRQRSAVNHNLARSTPISTTSDHLQGMLTRMNIPFERKQKINKKMGTGYLIVGTTPAGLKYAGAPDESSTHERHAIAVRDGLIMDNNVPVPVPYSRENLNKFLLPQNLEIYKLKTDAAPTPKMIPVNRKKRAATRTVDYTESKRRKYSSDNP